MFHNQAAPAQPLSEFAPRDAIRTDFANRLQGERIRKGWNQSELARQAALHTADKRFGRDLVSSYERGRMLPGTVHLAALSKALGIASSQLLPVGTLPKAGEATPPLSTQDLGDGRTWLRINQAVSWDVALRIMQLIKGSPHEGNQTG